MSKKKETIFAEKIDRDLKAAFGKNVWLENIQQVGKVGTPDRLICLKGHFIAIEIKTDEGVTSTLQVIKLAEIIQAGGKSFIVNPSNWAETLIKLKTTYGT